MKTWAKCLACVVLAFSCLFSYIGYAAVSDTLAVTGHLAFALPDYDEVIITGITAEGGAERPMWLVPTTVNSTVNLAAGETVTYTITVKNYSDRIKYAYSGVKVPAGMEELEDNRIYLDGGLSVEVSIPEGTAILPGEVMTFTATYSAAAGHQNQDIQTLLNYKFGVHVDSMGDVAIDGALSKFQNILNTPTEYASLTGRMDEKDSSANAMSYIGNVIGSSSTDSALLNALFEGELTLNIDGVETNVTVMIKRENVDGDESTGNSYTHVSSSWWGADTSTTYPGCEMTIYLTAYDFDGARNGLEIPVYAGVFTQKDGGEWYQIGDMYEGEASVNGYEWPHFNADSFNTETWATTAEAYKGYDGFTYVDRDGVSHTVEDFSYALAANRNISQIVQANASAAEKTTLATLLSVADIVNAEMDRYAASDEMIDAFRKARAEAAALSDQANIRQVELIPVMRELARTIRPFAGTSTQV